MNSATRSWLSFAIGAALFVLLPQLFVGSATHARVITIAGICLVLWITEIVPPFVPTLLLWTSVPLFLAPIDPRFTLPKVLSWAADPVMALFFGGFALGVAADRSGLGMSLTRLALNRSTNSYGKFLFLVMLITAFLSMWISNIAAAALVFASMRPILDRCEKDDLLRRILLIGVALGADFGGIATPIGTGPNAIAIASISQTQPVSFLRWMVFAFPLMIGMLVASFLFLSRRTHRAEGVWKGTANLISDDKTTRDEAFPLKTFFVVFIGTAVLWLTEPIHKVPAAVIALGSAGILFLSRILSRKDLLRIDWSTLLLIAGGITLGRLLEQSGLVSSLTSDIPFAELHPTISLFLLCVTAATLSALMSNTATVVLLIPLATAFMPSPSTAILVAISASFGVPLLISTPPNAMAFGHGGVKFGDLFWPGIVLMLGGCVLIALTGRQVLNFAGIP